MNSLDYLSFLEFNPILLQNVSNSSKINLILILAGVVIILTIAVLMFAIRSIQIVLKAYGVKSASDEGLSTEWVNTLYFLTIGLVVISLYLYTQLV